MPLILTETYEDRNAGNYTFRSTPPPTNIAGGRAGAGERVLNVDINSNAQYGYYQFPTPPSTFAVSFYVEFVTLPSAAADIAFLYFKNGATNKETHLRIVTTAGGGKTVKLRHWDGVTAYDSATTTVVTGTIYRIEAKYDWSATGFKATWGIATGDGPLTTIDTDFVGGNTFTADTMTYMFVGIEGVNAHVLRFDDVRVSNTGTEYPVGPFIRYPVFPAQSMGVSR